MTTSRRIGSVAAVFSLTASVALLTGLPGAAAGDASNLQTGMPAQPATGAAPTDDLAQLKANQQLLQQRIDQLALGAPQGVPAAGAASLAGSFPRSFLIPGTDTSLLIGGYVKLDVCAWLEGGAGQIGNNQLCGLEGPPIIASTPLDSHGTGLFAAAFFNAHSRGTGVFDITARESRLRVETRTPTAWGEAGTVWEMDFYGCQAGGGGTCSQGDYGPSSQVPRLRLAYGTLGGFIAGQAFMPGINLDANPETLDFSGDVGTFGVARMPMVGYKWAGPWGMSLGGYLLEPAVNVYSSAGAISTAGVGGTATSITSAGSSTALTNLGVNPAKQTWPDLNLVARWQQPWGSLQITGLVQNLELNDGAFISKDYIGYGGAVETDIHPGWFGWSKDHIGAQAWAGNGLDRFGANPTGTEPGPWAGLATNFGGPGVGCYGYATTFAGGTLSGQSAVSGGGTVPLCTAAGNTAGNAARVIATTVVSYGGEVNYQHWWLPNLRSNVTFGFQEQDIPTQLVGLTNQTVAYNRRLVSSHMNLIWSPVAFINTGFEGIWGNRQTVWNQTGNEWVVDYSFQVKF